MKHKSFGQLFHQLCVTAMTDSEFVSRVVLLNRFKAGVLTNLRCHAKVVPASNDEVVTSTSRVLVAWNFG